MKKIIIIGAGIGGLSAGIFGRKMGFDTEIYEMHSIPGGECTGWDRKGYHFDNCIHWLTGTSKETELYKLWKTVGALENVEVYNADYFHAVNHKSKTVLIYRDVDKLEKHLLDISPEDKDEILYFIETIKKLQKFDIPIEKPMDMMNMIDYAKLAKKYAGVTKYISEFSKISVYEYSMRFKNESIKQAIGECVPGYYSATALFFTLATFTSGNGGWPMGGSLALSLRMEKKYKGIGGRVKYNSKVKRIIIEKGIAKGIELDDGKIIKGDYIISAVDAKLLLTKLLGNKYHDKTFDIQFGDPEKYPVNSSVDIGLGVKVDLSSRNHTESFEVEPFKCGSIMVDRLSIKHYCHEGSFAPKGCSTIRIHIMCNDYEYWKKLKKNKEEYCCFKDDIAKEIIDRVEKIYPETKGNVEVYDVCTPVTYERYCGAYRGAWMAFGMTTKGKTLNHDGRIKGIQNLHIAGQWVMMPGGLPVALVSGKWSIQRICKDEKINFIIS